MGNFQATRTVSSTVATPPVKMAKGTPKAAATSPASSSPSCGPPMKNIMLTLVIRPRRASGVDSWRTVPRMTVETASAAPTSMSITKDTAKVFERPKMAVAAPKMTTQISSSGPWRRSCSPRVARALPAMTAPTESAVASQP